MKIPDIETYRSLVNQHPNELIVIDLSAQWCGPCKRIKPAYNSLKMAGVIFCSVDIDECEELATHFNVSAVPTFVFVRGGNLLDRVNGANLDAVIAMCNKHK